MKISIFTPVHPPSLPYLIETAKTVFNQTYKNWQWIILYNSGATPATERTYFFDERIKPIVLPKDHDASGVIGFLKKMACKEAMGDILVELDADDLIRSDTLERVHEAFKDDSIVFAYSDFACFKNKTWENYFYSSRWGWQNYKVKWEDHDLTAMKAFIPSCNTFRRIEWAPNHIRAFRRTSYKSIGGHNSKLKNGDDHDLLCRLYVHYGKRAMKYLPECLYFYRLHDDNSCVVENKVVQDQVKINYDNYYEKMALKDARDARLLAIELGGGIEPAPGYITVDLKGSQIEADLEKKWPFNNDSVGAIRAYHILEHLSNPVHAMNEAYRVLAPGGVFFIEVPSTDGRGAFQDPTHKSFWNENSFWYYTQKKYSRYIGAQYNGRFQASRVKTMFPGKWWERNKCPVVRAELIALKASYEENRCGEILI